MSKARLRKGVEDSVSEIVKNKSNCWKNYFYYIVQFEIGFVGGSGRTTGTASVKMVTSSRERRIAIRLFMLSQYQSKRKGQNQVIGAV